MAETRIRVTTATLEGEMLFEGQRVGFTAEISRDRVDVRFDERSNVDAWRAFRLLERWIDEHLRG